MVLLALAACATVPKKAASDASEIDEAWEDASRPNLASMYYLMSGSYLSLWGDYAVADQVLNLAIAQDSGSPQLRKAYFENAVNYYRSARNADASLRLQELLSEARLNYQFDRSMLHEAYKAYESLGDMEGMAWAVDELESKYPDAWTLFYKYTLQKERYGTADTKLLQQAEKLNKDDTRLDQLIALSWMGEDDDKAISILQELPSGILNEALLLSLLDKKGDPDIVDKRFESFSYPEDSQAMTGFLFYYNQKPDAQRIFAHQDKILATGDTGMLVVLATSVVQAESDESYYRMLDYLEHKVPSPQADSKYAAILLFHAIRISDQRGIRELSDRIFASGDLNSALYTAILPSGISEEELANRRQKIVADIRKNLDNGLLSNYLLYILSEDEDPESPAQLQFSEALWDRGYGDKNDVMAMLDFFMQAGDERSQIFYLRDALKRWPNDAMLMNNLGYLLLSSPEDWDEAERLISAAIKQEPNSVSYLDSMAWLHYLRGEYGKALEYIPTIEASSVKSAELFYHIGMIYLALEQRDTALRYLQMSVDAAYPENYSNMAKEQLKILK
jgi:Tfp pilus assembly protein PilF